MWTKSSAIVQHEISSVILNVLRLNTKKVLRLNTSVCFNKENCNMVAKRLAWITSEAWCWKLCRLLTSLTLKTNLLLLCCVIHILIKMQSSNTIKIAFNQFPPLIHCDAYSCITSWIRTHSTRFFSPLRRYFLENYQLIIKSSREIDDDATVYVHSAKPTSFMSILEVSSHVNWYRSLLSLFQSVSPYSRVTLHNYWLESYPHFSDRQCWNWRSDFECSQSEFLHKSSESIRFIKFPVYLSRLRYDDE